MGWTGGTVWVWVVGAVPTGLAAEGTWGCPATLSSTKPLAHAAL